MLPAPSSLFLSPIYRYIKVRSWSLTGDISEIDTSFYVLTVDLWNADGEREVNLVRHSAISPSISSATSSSYPPPPQNVQTSYPSYSYDGYGADYPLLSPDYNSQISYQNFYDQAGPQGRYSSPMERNYFPQDAPRPMQSPRLPHISSGAVGMFTRNLIGSLSASAFRLTDLDNKIGVWFILQDLSVRTEGSFR